MVEVQVKKHYHKMKTFGGKTYGSGPSNGEEIQPSQDGDDTASTTKRVSNDINYVDELGEERWRLMTVQETRRGG